MRGVWMVAAAVAVGGLAAAPARAGLYFTTGTLVPQFARPDDPDAQEPWPSPGNFSQFQLQLADYRAAAAGTDQAAEHSTGRRYRRRVAELEAKDSRGLLSLDDRI